jgi:hypothetical protein
MALSKIDQTAADVLTTAVEGGINYWSCVSAIERDADLNIIAVTIHEVVPDPEDEAEPTFHTGGYFPEFYKRDGVRITLTEIKRAMRKIADGKVGVHSARFATVTSLVRHGTDDTDFDANDADDITQVAVLGALVYG